VVKVKAGGLHKGKPHEPLVSKKTQAAGATTPVASPRGIVAAVTSSATAWSISSATRTDVPAVERLEYDPNRTRTSRC
jgi:ribosomal protein L2